MGPEEDYAPASLVTEGFIHCSPDATTLLTVANRFYTDATEPMIALWIDPSQLTAEVRWEAPDPPAPGIPDRMPHVYGPSPIGQSARSTPCSGRRPGGMSRFFPSTATAKRPSRPCIEAGEAHPTHRRFPLSARARRRKQTADRSKPEDTDQLSRSQPF